MRLRQLSFIFLLAAALLFPIVVNAQTIIPVKRDIVNNKTSVKPTISLEKKAVIMGKLQTVKNTIISERKQLKEELELKRHEASKSSLLKHQQFIKRLDLLKDERKKEKVATISGKITTFNLNHTNRLADVLDKIQSILDRVSKKAETAKGEGYDTGVLALAIKNAQTAIDAARIAISSQALKQYTIQITSDATIKTNVGSVVSQFRTDLKAIHKLVIDAKQATMRAVSELAKLRGVNNGLKPTVVPTVTTVTPTLGATVTPTVTPTLNPTPTAVPTGSAGT